MKKEVSTKRHGNLGRVDKLVSYPSHSTGGYTVVETAQKG